MITKNLKINLKMNMEIDNDEKNSAINDIVCTIIYVGVFILAFLHSLVVLSFGINKKAENYKLIKTEQIYDIRGKTTYYDSQFIIDRIKKCSKDKHGKTCYGYYIFYTKQDNQKIQIELPESKTQITNNSKTFASIDTYKYCKFYKCDYKYNVNLPINKKPIFV